MSFLIDVTIFFGLYAIAIFGYLIYRFCSSSVTRFGSIALYLSFAFQLLLETYDVLTDMAQANDFFNGMDCGTSACSKKYPKYGEAMVICIILGSTCTVLANIYFCRKAQKMKARENNEEKTLTTIQLATTKKNTENATDPAQTDKTTAENEVKTETETEAKTEATLTDSDDDGNDSEDFKLMNAEIVTEILKILLEDLPVLFIYYTFLEGSKVVTYSGNDFVDLMHGCYMNETYTDFTNGERNYTWNATESEWGDLSWMEGGALADGGWTEISSSSLLALMSACLTDAIKPGNAPITISNTLLIGLAFTFFDLIYVSLSLIYKLFTSRAQFLRKKCMISVLFCYVVSWLSVLIATVVLFVMILSKIEEMKGLGANSSIGLLSVDDTCVTDAYYVLDAPDIRDEWTQKLSSLSDSQIHDIFYPRFVTNPLPTAAYTEINNKLEASKSFNNGEPLTFDYLYGDTYSEGLHIFSNFVHHWTVDIDPVQCPIYEQNLTGGGDPYFPYSTFEYNSDNLVISVTSRINFKGIKPWDTSTKQLIFKFFGAEIADVTSRMQTRDFNSFMIFGVDISWFYPIGSNVSFFDWTSPAKFLNESGDYLPSFGTCFDWKYAIESNININVGWLLKSADCVSWDAKQEQLNFCFDTCEA